MQLKYLFLILSIFIYGCMDVAGSYDNDNINSVVTSSASSVYIENQYNNYGTIYQAMSSSSSSAISIVYSSKREIPSMNGQTCRYGDGDYYRMDILAITSIEVGYYDYINYFCCKVGSHKINYTSSGRPGNSILTCKDSDINTIKESSANIYSSYSFYLVSIDNDLVNHKFY